MQECDSFAIDNKIVTFVVQGLRQGSGRSVRIRNFMQPKTII
jgi:hypothetical protein